MLAYRKSITLLPAMVAGIQSGLRALVKSLCQVVAIIDSEGRPVVNSEGRPRVKTPKPWIELPYAYLMAWYVMHCPSLMTAVPSSKGFVPFMQKLENSSWTHYYMFFIQKSILNILNYLLEFAFDDTFVKTYHWSSIL